MINCLADIAELCLAVAGMNLFETTLEEGVYIDQFVTCQEVQRARFEEIGEREMEGERGFERARVSGCRGVHWSR